MSYPSGQSRQNGVDTYLSGPFSRRKRVLLSTWMSAQLCDGRQRKCSDSMVMLLLCACRGQAEKEFRVEVEAIGRVRHKNLVRLLGYCAEGAHR